MVKRFLLVVSLLFFVGFFFPANVFAAPQLIITPSAIVKPGDDISLVVTQCQKTLKANFYYIFKGARVDLTDSNTPPNVSFGQATLNHKFSEVGSYQIFAECAGELAQASLSIDSSPPDSPAISEKTASDKDIYIKWNKVGGANSYEVYYAKEADKDFTAYSREVVGNTTEWDIAEGIQPDTLYLIYVKACNNNGCSAPSQTRPIRTATASPTSLTPTQVPTPSPTPLPPQPPCSDFQIKKLPDGTEVKVCAQIKTDFGDIPTDPAQFISKIYGIILGITGGIAVLLIIYAGYKLMLSQGDPEKTKGAHETITSAIVGLLFIILAFVIYQVVANDILHIPLIKR